MACSPTRSGRPIGADSLAYVVAAELVEATTVPASQLCTACFTGDYPVELPEPEQLGKHLLEGFERRARRDRGTDVDGLATVDHRGRRGRRACPAMTPGAVDGGGATYAAAGVDIDAGDRAVELMKASVARASRPEVVGGLGGFAGLFDVSAVTRHDHVRCWRPRPTASAPRSTSPVGWTCTTPSVSTWSAMVLDDLVVCGAEPLFMTDYIATGKVRPERIAAIVSGVAEGCRQAGAALVGGETAEHPGLLEPDEYDLAGAGVGVVDAPDLLGPDRVRAR